MMDRNLGAGRNANSAVKTNSTSVDFEDRGLFYQWGRKDPFIYNFNIEGARHGDGTGWELFSQSAIPAEAEAAAIAYCIAHPSKYMPRKDALAKDWFTNNRNISRGNRLWNGGILTNESAEAYKQSARETVDANKSVFDPCPPGYRMPISGIWGKTNNDTSELVGSWRHYLGNWMKIAREETSTAVILSKKGTIRSIRAFRLCKRTTLLSTTTALWHYGIGQPR